MKVKSLLLGLFLLTLGTTAFAGTGTRVIKLTKPAGAENTSVKSKNYKSGDAADVKAASCTVTVSWVNADHTKTSISITATCECTQQKACDAAYRVASIAIPD